MNAFEYELLINKINNTKTGVGLREIIYEIAKTINILNPYAYSIKDKDIQSVALLYKCFILTESKYKAATKIPDYIYSRFYQLEKTLMKYFAETSKDFEALIDTFEYNSSVKTAYYNRDNLIHLIKLIGTNTTNFEIIHEYCTNSKYSHMLTYTKPLEDRIVFGRSYATAAALELEDIRRELGNKHYTLLDEMLETCYTNFRIDDLTEIDNLHTVLTTFKRELNGRVSVQSNADKDENTQDKEEA